MVNLLFLLATAQASDVYEICMIKNQTFSEREQIFHTDNTQTFFSHQPVQLIIHEQSIEVDRDKREILSINETSGCLSMNEKSNICFNDEFNRFEWEWVMRSGVTKRDLMYVCSKNGRPI